MIAICLLTVFSGCQSAGHHSKNEVSKWAEEVTGQQIVVNNEYVDEKNEDGYTNRIWTAYYKSCPEITFKIIDTEYEYMEVSEWCLTSLHDYAVGEYYFNKFNETNNISDLFPEITSYYQTQFSLRGDVKTLDDIYGLVEEMKSIEEYFAQQEIDFHRSYVLYIEQEQLNLKTEIRVNNKDINMLEYRAIAVFKSDDN